MDVVVTKPLETETKIGASVSLDAIFFDPTVAHERNDFSVFFVLRVDLDKEPSVLRLVDRAEDVGQPFAKQQKQILKQRSDDACVCGREDGAPDTPFC